MNIKIGDGAGMSVGKFFYVKYFAVDDHPGFGGAFIVDVFPGI